MARVCIQAAANRHPTDAKLDPLRLQQGDVVEIVEDGHVWSKAELGCGQYRFIDISGVSAAELAPFVEAKRDATGTMTARRLVTLDRTALASAAWRSRTMATKAQLEAIVVTRV